MNLDINNSSLNNFLSLISHKYIPSHVSSNYKCCHISLNDFLSHNFSVEQLQSLTSNFLHVDSITSLIDAKKLTLFMPDITAGFEHNKIYYRKHTIKLYVETIGKFQKFFIYETIQLTEKPPSQECDSNLHFILNSGDWTEYKHDINAFSTEFHLFNINSYSSYSCHNDNIVHYNVSLSLIGDDYIINIPDVYYSLDNPTDNKNIYNISFFNKYVVTQYNPFISNNYFSEHILELDNMLSMQGYKPYLFFYNINADFQSFCSSIDCKMFETKDFGFFTYAFATAELIETTNDIWTAISTPETSIKLREVSKILFMEFMFFISTEQKVHFTDIHFGFDFSLITLDQYKVIDAHARILLPLISFSSNPVDYLDIQEHLVHFENDFYKLITTPDNYNNLLLKLYKTTLKIFNNDLALFKNTLLFIYPKIFY